MKNLPPARKLQYMTQAALAYTLFFFFWIMGPRLASALGAWLGARLGPSLGISRKARENLRLAFPAKPQAWHEETLRACWAHTGRVIAEYPHIARLARSRIELVGAPALEAALKSGNGAIFISGHMGNWELLGPFIHAAYGAKGSITYRAPNNLYLDSLLVRARGMRGAIASLPKRRDTGRALLTRLRNREFVGILIDQKFNSGLKIPFLGRPAMTNPIAVELALRYDCPLIPIRCERLSGTRFRFSAYPPVALRQEGDTPRSAEDVLQECNKLLESWIIDQPEQWLWMHKRWDSKQISADQKESESP